MKIQLHEITIRELVAGYRDDGDGGVVGYGGKLDIRPPFQREFIYKEKERNAVIDSVLKGFPLNVMYWSAREDGAYEIIDGQQRTISIAQYVAEKPGFSFNDLYFDNLARDIKDKILDYKLMVYVCSGTDSERLDWFRIINIAGVKLTEQELRNAVYAGPWVTDAKRYFSRRGGSAYQLGGDYLSGSANRQEYLETAIKWISDGNIEEYMGRQQHEASAEPLWDYFRAVIDWVKVTFTVYRKPMKGVDWGGLYNCCKDADLDAAAIEIETARLILDDDVTNQKGIYPYILTDDEKHLNIRAFTAGMKQRVYEKQAGLCAVCGEEFTLRQMEADHIAPWSAGGKTVEDNCQMLCKKCNREKAAK
ncbi:MAG: DUF262 domain-containing protein [Chloroflexi bacterium]|nr:DUF262 domain-containing protein [Chloroflexota bacterium]